MTVFIEDLANEFLETLRRSSPLLPTKSLTSPVSLAHLISLEAPCLIAKPVSLAPPVPLALIITLSPQISLAKPVKLTSKVNWLS